MGRAQRGQRGVRALCLRAGEWQISRHAADSALAGSGCDACEPAGRRSVGGSAQRRSAPDAFEDGAKWKRTIGFLNVHKFLLRDPFSKAPINGAVFTTSLPQSCAPSFQLSGYNYSNPGQNVFRIGLRGQIWVYEQVTSWTSPCDSHEIGVDKPKIRELRRELRRASF
jgi:hypothetical protein